MKLYAIIFLILFTAFLVSGAIMYDTGYQSGVASMKSEFVEAGSNEKIYLHVYNKTKHIIRVDIDSKMQVIAYPELTQEASYLKED